MIQLFIVPITVLWIGQITVLMDVRNEVVQYSRSRKRTAQATDACNRIVMKAFEKACHANQVRLEAGEERLTKQFCGLPAVAVPGIVVSDRLQRIPNADVVLRQQVVERGADRLNRLREQTIKRDDHLMIATLARHRQGQGQAVAADPAKAACRLRALQVDDDAHGARKPGVAQLRSSAPHRSDGRAASVRRRA